MKSSRILLIALALLVALPVVRAQNTSQDEKSGTAEVKDKKGHEVATVSPTPAGVPLKILVVIGEYDGSKKISSLPYTLHTTTYGIAGPHAGTRDSMRYGVRVPISEGGNSWTYQSVGTNIDYGAYEAGGGDYQLVFTVDRTWVGMPGENTMVKTGSVIASPDRPLLPTFRNSFTLVLGNGQTAEGVSAVDPVTGHVLKVDVTLTVLK